MKKRTFIKSSSLLVSGAFLSPLISCSPQKPETVESEKLKNWAGNLHYSTTNVHYPDSVGEVQALVSKYAKMRPLGSMHSFSTIADSEENLISMKKLNKVVSLDKAHKRVTVEGGIKYGELCRFLYEEGFALHNLASLPHISVAGSIATATHGSGLQNGNLAKGVSGIEFVNGKGELVQLSREDGDHFYGAVVGLGSLGPVTKVTLDLEPVFDVAQVVYRNLPMEALKENFESIMGAGYSVSLFTDWRNNNINQVWVKKKVGHGESSGFSDDFFGAETATEKLHPVEGQSAESCSEQMGISGPWYDRLPHFKMEFQPSAGKELQSEYFVPLESAYDAITAVAELAEQISPHLFVSEIRTIKGDNFWMSPCYQQDSIAIHTTWKQEIPEVMALLPLIEEKLAPFNAKPHWGKLFTISQKMLQNRYERMEDFKSLIKSHDPEGKFRNDYIDQNIFDGKTI